MRIFECKGMVLAFGLGCLLSSLPCYASVDEWGARTHHLHEESPLAASSASAEFYEHAIFHRLQSKNINTYDGQVSETMTAILETLEAKITEDCALLDVALGNADYDYVSMLKRVRRSVQKQAYLKTTKGRRELQAIAVYLVRRHRAVLQQSRSYVCTIL